MPLFSQWGVYSLAERDARRDEFRAAHRHRSGRGPDAEVHRSLSGLVQSRSGDRCSTSMSSVSNADIAAGCSAASPRRSWA
jgi:hypothetical protein